MPTPTLVGSLGTLASGSPTASPAFGQATTAGNLLVAWVSGVTNVTPSCSNGTWTRINDSIGRIAIFYKANCGASETAPTFTAGTTAFARMAEFSGVLTVSPNNASAQSGTVTTSPAVATNPFADSTRSHLMLSVTSIIYSMAATKTTSDTYNNGASATDAGNNDATSSTHHYRFSYGVTTGNTAADSDSHAFTTTNISGATLLIATFAPRHDPTPILVVAPRGELRP